RTRMKYVQHKSRVTENGELADIVWVDIIPQKGAIVSSKKIKTKTQQLIETTNTPTKTAFPVETNYVLDSPYQSIQTDLYFTDGTPDYRLNNLKSLNQIFSAVSSKKSTSRQLNKDLYTESKSLKNQLQNYLYITKRLAIQTNQIVTFQNNQLAIQNIFHTLLRPNDKVIVPQFGNFEVNMKLKERRVDLITVKTNSQGIDIHHL